MELYTILLCCSVRTKCRRKTWTCWWHRNRRRFNALKKKSKFLFWQVLFVSFWMYFIDEGNALIQKTGSWNGRQVSFYFSILYYLTEITINSHFVNAVNQWPVRKYHEKITVYAAYVHTSLQRNSKMLGLMDFQIPMRSNLNILCPLFSTCRLLDSPLQKEENVNRMKLAPLLRPLKTERLQRIQPLYRLNTLKLIIQRSQVRVSSVSVSYVGLDWLTKKQVLV